RRKRTRVCPAKLFSVKSTRDNTLTPFQKQFGDKCGGFWNWKGWISVLANFFLVAIVPYIVVLYLVLLTYLAPGKSWPFRVALGLSGGAVFILIYLTDVLVSSWNRRNLANPVRLDEGVKRNSALGWKYTMALIGFLGSVWLLKGASACFVLKWIME